LAPGKSGAAAESAVDASQLIQQMRAALEPGKDMRATFDLEITNPKPDQSIHWVGTYYRRGGRDARTRIAFDAPVDLRGTQVSVRRDENGTTHTRMYLPLIRRVRDLQTDTRSESFLGT